MVHKTGILLVNLGTPDAPESGAVRRYLREFLSDPRVIDIPAPVRFGLVNGIIAPFRAPKSAAAYREVWTDRGSPLLVHGLDLRDRLRERLPEVSIELAMRYGNPSVAASLDTLRAASCNRILVAPLYPQYASSSTGSSLECVYRHAAEHWNTPYVEVLPAFYDDPRFLDAFAAVGRPVLERLRPDHVLFSYHGLPERHCTKSDESGRHCLAQNDCCASIVDANRNCYRAQCFATTRGLRERLDLDTSNSTITFQSRLGRTPWIQPYTDGELVRLAQTGTKRMAVFCPAFVADCLETLEEIGMRALENFRGAGGEELELVPSLNATPAWVDGLGAMLEERL
ncbi:MAG: ferrochelatase [bacterium]|nr:ferrochelatase [bacterium]